MGARRLDRRVAERHKLPEKLAREGRFSRGYPLQPRRIARAEIYDISYSGIAFRISADVSPDIGELVAIEFRLPNAPRMAWYAQVVRLEIEHFSTDPEHNAVIKIGAKFLELPTLRRKILERHIDELHDNVHKDQGNRIPILTEALKVRRSHEITHWRWIRATLLFVLSIGFGAWFVHFMMSIGSPSLRGNGPPIWPKFNPNQLESPGTPNEDPKDFPLKERAEPTEDKKE
jgi:hypothetical protein